MLLIGVLKLTLGFDRIKVDLYDLRFIRCSIVNLHRWLGSPATPAHVTPPGRWQAQVLSDDSRCPFAALLDHRDINAAPGQIKCERQPDRPRTNNQDG